MKVYHIRLDPDQVRVLRQKARVISAQRAIDVSWQEYLREGLASLLQTTLKQKAVSERSGEDA